MDRFDNVAVLRKANIYFDGGVTSRTIQFSTGEIKTLGVILPGEYHFDTGKREIMEIQSGEVEVQLQGDSGWRCFRAGDIFEIAANSAFRIRTAGVADYCCSFVD